jgi:hypothetical protein
VTESIKVTDNWLGKQKTEGITGPTSAIKPKNTNRFTVQVLKDWKNDLENAEETDGADTPRQRRKSAQKSRNITEKPHTES